MQETEEGQAAAMWRGVVAEAPKVVLGSTLTRRETVGRGCFLGLLRRRVDGGFWCVG